MRCWSYCGWRKILHQLGQKSLELKGIVEVIYQIRCLKGGFLWEILLYFRVFCGEPYASWYAHDPSLVMPPQVRLVEEALLHWLSENKRADTKVAQVQRSEYLACSIFSYSSLSPILCIKFLTVHEIEIISSPKNSQTVCQTLIHGWDFQATPTQSVRSR